RRYLRPDRKSVDEAIAEGTRAFLCPRLARVHPGQRDGKEACSWDDSTSCLFLKLHEAAYSSTGFLADSHMTVIPFFRTWLRKHPFPRPGRERNPQFLRECRPALLPSGRHLSQQFQATLCSTLPQFLCRNTGQR